MPKGQIRDMFPGGNTPQGFISFYDHILTQNEASRIFILKGGPGVGKSTFMKQTGHDLVAKGLDIEFMHCSSDPDSLDGLVIPSLKVALIDGTAPHIVDPKTPGAVDEIINLGSFWNREAIALNKAGILEINAKIGSLYQRGYKYLKAAKSIYDDMNAIYQGAQNHQQIVRIAEALIAHIFKDEQISASEGRKRCLFASAITSQGLLHYLPSILHTERMIALIAKSGSGASIILEMLTAYAISRGYHVECFYCPIDPNKLEHIVIGEKGISVTTFNKYHNCLCTSEEFYELDALLDQEVLLQLEAELKDDQKLFDQLLDMTVSCFSKAKLLHDEMEQFYIPNMDFDALQACRRELVDQLLGVKTS